MRRNLVAVGLWLAATLVAVALATAAIDTVVERTPSRDAGLAVGELAPSPSAPDPSGPDPTSAAAAPSTRTYELVGGSVAARRAGERVELRWATPATGFAVEVDDDDDEVDVEFRGDAHRSRLRLWVEDGRLRAEVDEDPR